ncbi:MAG: phosphoserine phosphatase SerB [Variibacter sp.]
MTHVATLISNPAHPSLDDSVIARARDALPAAGETTWLAADIAADIAVEIPSADAKSVAARARAKLGDVPVDIVVQPVAGRRKHLLIADMDSTMIQQECIDELADYVGLRAHIAAITERAMRGEIAFEPALRERVALLKGLPVAVIDEVIRERIVLMPGGRALIATMRKNGAHTCLVSGGFVDFVDRVAAMIGFDAAHGNRLERYGDALSGVVTEPILGREAKLETLITLRTKFGLERDDTLAVGDGANDLAMLGEAGLGVAYHAKPAVAAAAAARIDHGDLTALLYLQGYRREEFAGT